MHSEGQAPSNLASEAIDIPTAVEVIAGMNAKSRDNALEAAEQRYWEVAWDCGGSDEAASAWVTSLMSHLQEQIERMRERQVYGGEVASTDSVLSAEEEAEIRRMRAEIGLSE